MIAPHDHDPHHDHGHDPHNGHGHDHHHGPGHVHVHVPAGADPRWALALALGLNGAFLFIEAGVGWWTDSLALLSDAAHMLSDVAALALALGAAQLARTQATSRMTFGLGRAEILGAYTNGLALLLACGWIAYEAIDRLFTEAPQVAGVPVLIVGAIGLAINLGSVWFLWRADRENLNVRAALLHMIADALGSVGAIVAAGLIMAGFPAADALISLLIAGLVTWSTVRVIRDAGRVLLELPPAGLSVDRVREVLLGTPSVVAIHDLHVWSVDGQDPLVAAHLVSDAAGPQVVEAAQRRLLDTLRIEHVTLQVEATTTPCEQVDCGAGAVAPLAVEAGSGAAPRSP